MFVRDAGNIMSSDPLELFERAIRPVEESSGPIPNLRVDKLLGFSDSENDRLLSALAKFYSAGHWASNPSSFNCAIEKAIQLLSAGLCSLKNQEFEDGHPLECCARIVNAPTLSPYIYKRDFNYVIVPVGFLSSMEKFISSTYAIATISASQKDPTGKTAVWDQDLFLGLLAVLADVDISTFTQGVLEASSESAMQEVVEGFSDPIVFSVFDREVQKKLMGMMPSASNWKGLGYRDLTEALTRHPEIKRTATKNARLSVCFTICHEFGHVFTLSVKAEGAQQLGSDETFTDMIGVLILYRLIEFKILTAIVDTEVTPRDLGHAVAAFHSWNLSKELAGLLKPKEGIKTEDAFSRIHEVAKRWLEAMKLIQKVWIDDVPALARVGESVSTGSTIVNHWGVMTSGMLRVALISKGHNIDMEEVCALLPLLSNRDSKLYAYLAG